MGYAQRLCKNEGILIRGPSHNLEVIVSNPKSNTNSTKVVVLGSSLLQSGLYEMSAERPLALEPDLTMKLRYSSKQRLVIGFDRLPRHYSIEFFSIPSQIKPRT